MCPNAIGFFEERINGTTNAASSFYLHCCREQLFLLFVCCGCPNAKIENDVTIEDLYVDPQSRLSSAIVCMSGLSHLFYTFTYVEMPVGTLTSSNRFEEQLI